MMESQKKKEEKGKPWSRTPRSVVDNLGVDPEEGLSAEEAARRLDEHGRNKLQTEKGKSVIEIAIDQFKSLIILLLFVSAVLSFSFGDFVEGYAIVAVILINAAIGFFTELEAVRSMEALRELTKVSAKVRRDGTIHEIEAEEIVPGDILILSGGDIITADVRLLQASKLRLNESALTGESLPVDKDTEKVSDETPLADRANMAYKGTAVARGAGEGVVVATGMSTELGNISSLVQEAEEEATPLEERLDGLGRKLIWVTLGLAVLVAISGYLSGRDLRLMIETAVALAVAAIPEGLPIVATVALARGMRRMAERNALINKLSSVETLGATSVIISDKTGTLTENQMTVTFIALAEGTVHVSGEGLDPSGGFSWEDQERKDPLSDPLESLLTVGLLCNDASLNFTDGEVSEAIGEPMEIALKIAGRKADLDDDRLLENMPEVREVAFDQETKKMATVHQRAEDQYYYAVKGSPENVFAVCSKIRTADGLVGFTKEKKDAWEEINRRTANRGLRVIAIAEKTTGTPDADPYKDLVFLGLVGMMDPPRDEVGSAIQSCKNAGIRVIMATGDHGETAKEIAKSVGMEVGEDNGYVLGEDLKDLDAVSDETREHYLKVNVFARVEPEQKLELINLHQGAGEIVAMTGDGVNDAPALKKADIGVAMGQRGTQVAKEAADMVLKDDFFGTIVTAVEQGRAIFNNIRKFVLYLLSCNISEIMVVTIASVLAMPLPILPLQILFLNLVTDVFPALALGMGEGDPTLMEEPPRDSDEPIMTKRHWFSMSVYGVFIMIAVLTGMGLALNALDFGEAQATTISFLILAFAQLWHVFNMRENGTNIFVNGVTRNKYVWFALLICVALLLMAVYVPFLANLLSLVNPTLTGWLIVLAGSLAPMLIGQVLKEFRFVK